MTPRVFALLSLILLPFLSAPALAEPGGTVIFDMDSIQHQPAIVTDKEKKKVAVGTVELVEGKVAQAVRFSFADGLPGFMTGRLHPSPAWDETDGFSFWVKGDGSDHCGGIELVDASNFGLRFGYCFPIRSTDWTKVTVRWTDLTPELAGPLMNPKARDEKDGYAPHRLGNFWFGKWFYWRDFAARAYTIDQVTLEKTIPQAPPLPDVPPGLQRVRAKLKAGKPVTIVTMGDSLTDTHHWSNRPIDWPTLLAKDLKAKYGSEVTIVNPAIGGTTLSQNVVLIPRWVQQAPAPDLVTVWFGGNDWGSDVHGPRFAEYLRLAVDRIRRQTGGSADVLLMTTCPSHAAWQTMAELEQAVRDVAKEKKTGIADVAAEFHKSPNADAALKAEYWAWDKTHLGAKGHDVAKETVLRAIESGG